MPFQKVEYEFPDPDNGENATPEDELKIEIEGNPAVEEAKKPPKKAKEDTEIEVVDDRPAEDKDKKRSKPPMELSDEEMESYSERVRKRLQHFSKGYHDQRRAAEAAQREAEEARRFAASVAEENKRLKGTVGKNQEVMLDQAKKTAASELEKAKQEYRAAYESGDAEKVVEAQEKLTAAKLREDRVNNLKLPTVQEDNSEVQTQHAPQPAVDERAMTWQNANKWFGEDDEMTSFALGLHQKLVKQGVNPRSDEYYEKINSRMRQVFPDQFSTEDDEDEHVEVEEPRRKANVVAPATRSVAPKKITLTRTQVALAKRLGLPLEVYAKQVAEDMRKQNG